MFFTGINWNKNTRENDFFAANADWWVNMYEGDGWTDWHFYVLTAFSMGHHSEIQLLSAGFHVQLALVVVCHPVAAAHRLPCFQTPFGAHAPASLSITDCAKRAVGAGLICWIGSVTSTERFRLQIHTIAHWDQPQLPDRLSAFFKSLCKVWAEASFQLTDGSNTALFTCSHSRASYNTINFKWCWAFGQLQSLWNVTWHCI